MPKRNTAAKTKQTNRQVIRLLKHFEKNVRLGYSDENYTELASVYNQLSRKLPLQEIHVLGEVWRKTYTENVSSKEIADVIDGVKSTL
jgi:hypothetical protein